PGCVGRTGTSVTFTARLYVRGRAPPRSPGTSDTGCPLGHGDTLALDARIGSSSAAASVRKGTAMSKKWVYLFDEVGEAESLVGSWDEARALLGGKGANLGDMTRLGVPVPPGFTVTTQACNAYLEA